MSSPLASEKEPLTDLPEEILELKGSSSSSHPTTPSLEAADSTDTPSLKLSASKSSSQTQSKSTLVSLDTPSSGTLSNGPEPVQLTDSSADSTSRKRPLDPEAPLSAVHSKLLKSGSPSDSPTVQSRWNWPVLPTIGYSQQITQLTPMNSIIPLMLSVVGWMTPVCFNSAQTGIIRRG